MTLIVKVFVGKAATDDVVGLWGKAATDGVMGHGG